METDVAPVRPGWLDLLLPPLKLASSGEHWVIGGIWDKACMVTKTGQSTADWAKAKTLPTSFTDNHINGNAVYSANKDYLELAKGWKCDAGVNAGYDQQMHLQYNASFPGKWMIGTFYKDCKPKAFAKELQ